MSKNDRKRTKWTVSFREEPTLWVVAARSENEVRTLARKRRPHHTIVTISPTDTPKCSEPKPKAKHPAQSQAKPAKAPAVQATPENIKALAREALNEYVRDGIAALMRGLFGAR